MDDILLALKGRKNKAVTKDDKDEGNCKAVKCKNKDGDKDEGSCKAVKAKAKKAVKAKGKDGYKDEGSCKAVKAKAETAVKAKGKVDATAGCSKCRWSARGCSKCRHPDFKGLKAGGA